MEIYRRIIYLPRCREYLSLVLLCLALTVLDIAVVEIHYRPLQAWDRIWVWHRIYTIVVFSTPVLLASVLSSSIPLATWLFFVFGLEDTMFYALQGYLPPQYWGVSVLGFWEPSLNLVSFFNLLGLITIILFSLTSYRLESNFMFRLKSKDSQ